MRKLRTFIVDDDREFAEGMADVLELHGYDVELAFTGEEALERIEKEDFDVTFMDVKLPGKNGVESFLEIRRSRPDTKVIMMTGYSVEQLLAQATDNGAWAVLHKPLDMAKVLKMLEGVKPAGVILLADDDGHQDGRPRSEHNSSVGKGDFIPHHKGRFGQTCRRPLLGGAVPGPESPARSLNT